MVKVMPIKSHLFSKLGSPSINTGRKGMCVRGGVCFSSVMDDIPSQELHRERCVFFNGGKSI